MSTTLPGISAEFEPNHRKTIRLLWLFQLWLQSQLLLHWRDPAGYAAAHNAGQLFPFAQMDQSIFGKLLAAHPIQSFLVDVPGPTQHFIGQFFLIRMFVGLLPAQYIPECHQQFASNCCRCLIRMFAFAQAIIHRSPMRIGITNLSGPGLYGA